VADVGAEQVHGKAAQPELRKYVMRHAARLAETGAHFGGWASGESGEPARDVLDVSQVIPVHPMGHHMAEVHHRMHVNRQDAAFDLSSAAEIANPRAPYSEGEKKYNFGDPDEYGSRMRIVPKAR
jgi:hypothetical protein